MNYNTVEALEQVLLENFKTCCIRKSGEYFRKSVVIDSVRCSKASSYVSLRYTTKSGKKGWEGFHIFADFDIVDTRDFIESGLRMEQNNTNAAIFAEFKIFKLLNKNSDISKLLTESPELASRLLSEI